MSLFIAEIHKNSVLHEHGVQKRDYLERINACSVHTKRDVQLAYNSSQLELEFRRDKEYFKVQIDADDLGILVADDNDEVFDVKLEEYNHDDDEHEGSTSVYQLSTATISLRPPSVSILKGIAWAFFWLNLLASIYLISTNLFIEAPGLYGASIGELNFIVLSIVIISTMSSAFFVAIAHVLAHLVDQANVTRKEIAGLRPSN